MNSMFDEGALQGLEDYNRRAARVTTGDDVDVTGYLMATVTRSEYMRGMQHGLALGAALNHQRLVGLLDERQHSVKV